MPKKLTHEEFIEKLKLENPTIEVLTKYNGNKNYITVKCKIDGTIWNTKPNWLKAGRGCQTCYNNRRGLSRLKNTDVFIEQAKQIHGDKYDYSKTNYINDSEKVCVICHAKDFNDNEHGEFWITPNKHLSSKQGCPVCARKKITTVEIIFQAKQIHNDKYDYSKTIYQGRFKPITIICPKHGEFKLSPDKHLGRKQGCPKCSNIESKGELIIKETLNNYNIRFEYQKKFDWLGKQSLDFYLPDYNIAIECQGEQHFKPVTIFKGDKGFNLTRKRDLIKSEKCKEHNIKILYYINAEKCFELIEPYTKENVFFLKNLKQINKWFF